MFTFYVFDWKYPFWENMVQKNQNGHFKSWILIPRLIEYLEFNRKVHAFWFQLVILFLDKFAAKKIKLLVQAELWYLH